MRKVTHQKPYAIIVDKRALTTKRDIEFLPEDEKQVAYRLSEKFKPRGNDVGLPLVTAKEVCFFLGIQRRALFRWYDWFEDDYYDKLDCPTLPPYYKDNSKFTAPRLWRRKDLVHLLVFKSWIRRNCFNHVKAKYENGNYPDDFLTRGVIVRRKYDKQTDNREN